MSHGYPGLELSKPVLLPLKRSMWLVLYIFDPPSFEFCTFLEPPSWVLYICLFSLYLCIQSLNIDYAIQHLRNKVWLLVLSILSIQVKSVNLLKEDSDTFCVFIESCLCKEHKGIPILGGPQMSHHQT